MPAMSTTIETESCCFDIEVVSTEHHGLQSDEIPIRATNHAGQSIFMILKRDQLKDALRITSEEAQKPHKPVRDFKRHETGIHCKICGRLWDEPPHMNVLVEDIYPRIAPPFSENDCGGVFDGHGVVSDADPGL